MASDDRENLEALLEKGLTDAKISPSTRFIKQTVDFIHELAKWNKSYNLTAVRDPLQMVPLHILDSMALYPFVEEQTQDILDVGSGGGLPGIPLAIAYPEKNSHCLIVMARKRGFLITLK